VALGAHATATSVGAVEYVKGLGAERVIDVRSEEFDREAGVFDVVIDTVGGQILQRSFPVLRRGGRLVTLAAPPDQAMAARFGIEAMFFIVTADREELAKLAQLADHGSLKVTIAQCFPLAEGATAYASGASRNRAPGKTVLMVRGDGTAG
jgi:NADPH:quinone reductase-like Zn-dependent oxidoreductase